MIVYTMTNKYTQALTTAEAYELRLTACQHANAAASDMLRSWQYDGSQAIQSVFSAHRHAQHIGPIVAQLWNALQVATVPQLRALESHYERATDARDDARQFTRQAIKYARNTNPKTAQRLSAPPALFPEAQPA